MDGVGVVSLSDEWEGEGEEIEDFRFSTEEVAGMADDVASVSCQPAVPGFPAVS